MSEIPFIVLRKDQGAVEPPVAPAAPAAPQAPPKPPQPAAEAPRAPRPVAVLHNGETGGAHYVYNVSGNLHNVKVRSNPAAAPGAGHGMYDHSTATVNGMDADQIGHSIGSIEKIIKEKALADPHSVHRYEHMLGNMRDNYAALAAHRGQFAPQKPASGERVMPKEQRPHVGPMVDGITGVLSHVRANNGHLKVRDRAQISTWFLNHFSKNFTKAARQITGNPNVKFNYETQQMEHLRPEDHQKLVNEGFYRDAASHVGKYADTVSKGPLPADFTGGVFAEHKGVGGPQHSSDAKGSDWYHEDFDKARNNFLSPIAENAAALRNKAMQAAMAQGVPEDQAAAVAERHVNDVMGKAGKYFAGKLGGHPGVAMAYHPEHGPVLHLPKDLAHHESLAALNRARESVARQIKGHMDRL